MSSHYAKPENALRKAEDLVKVNKESVALKTLHTILLSKRYRVWQPTHEKIMFLYLQLAVGLRRNCKDALVQYRMICSTTGLVSLEKVVRQYLALSEAKANEAQASLQATQASQQLDPSSVLSGISLSLELEDLEEESPSDIIALAWSGARTRERADRAVLVPWIRYLWETYRTVLDVLRNNQKLEPLYHDVAKLSFDFCRRYKRSHEFRRLGEILRHHIFNIQKFAHQTNSVDLNNSDTQNRYLETRFEQLRIAASLELWQEAYRTIEDIHDNMKQSTSQPKPSLMKLYYEKLAAIFWASENYLFHAYSLSKFYQLSVTSIDNSPVISGNEKASLASAVLLATLIIPNNETSETEDSINEGNIKLAALLGFKREPPTRARLLASLVTPYSNSSNATVLSDASEPARITYGLLEDGYGPLTLHAKLAPNLVLIEENSLLSRYSDALKHLSVVRVLQQLSNVYRTIRLESFMTLVPAFDSDKMERVIMASINDGNVSLRIDHANKLIVFSDPSIESVRFKDQLVSLSSALAHIADRLAPVDANAKGIERQHVFSAIRKGELAEHEAVFERQSEIEKRKQEEEKNAAEKERKDAAHNAQLLEERKIAEKKRMAEESQKREEERIKREKAQYDLQVKKKMAEEMARKLETVNANSKSVKKLKALTEDVGNIDAQALQKAQAEVLDAERREFERKKREILRKTDYFVRASRIEERELLIKAAETQKNVDRDAFDADFAKFLEQDKLAHAKAVKEKERILRMLDQKNIFYEKVMKGRTEIFNDQKAKQDERVRNAAIARRREERRLQAIEEERRINEEKRVAAERAKRLEAEEKARAEEEAKQRLKDEQAEQRRKLDEIARKQREREAEIERREQERRMEREKANGSSPGPASSGTGKWQPRFKQNQDNNTAGPSSNDGNREYSAPYRARGPGPATSNSYNNDTPTERRWTPSNRSTNDSNNDSPSSNTQPPSSNSSSGGTGRWTRGGGAAGAGAGASASTGRWSSNRERSNNNDSQDSQDNTQNSSQGDDGFERVNNYKSRNPGRR